MDIHRLHRLTQIKRIKGLDGKSNHLCPSVKSVDQVLAEDCRRFKSQARLLKAFGSAVGCPGPG
jgi:hypothetical protein